MSTLQLKYIQPLEGQTPVTVTRLLQMMLELLLNLAMLALFHFGLMLNRRKVSATSFRVNGLCHLLEVGGG